METSSARRVSIEKSATFGIDPPRAFAACRLSRREMMTRQQQRSLRRFDRNDDALTSALEFLPLDAVCAAKQVSSGFCAAARRALTRGRWRPVRTICVKDRTLLDFESESLKSICRAAWAVAPGVALAGTVFGDDALSFLNIVEPVVDEEAIFRVVASFEYWFRITDFRVLGIFYDWTKMGESEEHADAMNEVMWCALGQWADGTLAANLINGVRRAQARDHKEMVETAERRTENWPDRRQAELFVAFFQDLHDDIEEQIEWQLEEEYGWMHNCEHGCKRWHCPECQDAYFSSIINGEDSD